MEYYSEFTINFAPREERLATLRDNIQRQNENPRKLADALSSLDTSLGKFSDTNKKMCDALGKMSSAAADVSKNAKELRK